jgi:hypothetical protein
VSGGRVSFFDLDSPIGDEEGEEDETEEEQPKDEEDEEDEEASEEIVECSSLTDCMQGLRIVGKRIAGWLSWLH